MKRLRVRELARSKGLTAEELARRAGVKVSTVERLWQNRAQDPRYWTLEPIARVLEVSVEQLWEEVPEGRGDVAEVEDSGMGGKGGPRIHEPGLVVVI